MSTLYELEEAYAHYKNDPGFQKELDGLLSNYAGRPSLLYYTENLTKGIGGATPSSDSLPRASAFSQFRGCCSS